MPSFHTGPEVPEVEGQLQGSILGHNWLLSLSCFAFYLYLLAF